MNEASQYISNLIEQNTAEFFLTLGRLNSDEIYDKLEIKYIITKNWQSRVFMANFKESSVFTTIEKLISAN